MIVLSGAGTSADPPDPSTIANLELWLQPRSIGVGDGNPISTWSDSSGNSRNATNVGTQRPTFRASGGSNNQPYVEFDGSDDTLVLPDFATGFTAGHIFYVVKIDNDPPGASGQAGPIMRASTTGGDPPHYPWTDGIIYDNWGSTSRKTVGDPTPALTSWRVYEVVSKSGGWTAWLDGTQLFTTGTNTVGFDSVLRIAVNQNGHRLDGGIHELIWYSAEKTGADKTTIKAYLSYWYGITIA